MKYRELLNDGRRRLLVAGKPESDARALLLFLKQWDLHKYLLTAEEDAADEEIEQYAALLEKRLVGIPLQQISGIQSFYGYDIAISPEVLTPRPETELLVERALTELQTKLRPRVLDLCTGSGCIAVTMAAENKNLQIVAIDISEKALEMARKNGLTHQVNDRILWLQSDLFVELTDEHFDLIISNPPYIPTAEIEELEAEVRQYDPLLALDGGADGLEFYRRIARDAGKYMNLTGGQLLLEIGAGQGKAVAELLQKEGWRGIQILPDLTGRERIIQANWNGSKK